MSTNAAKLFFERLNWFKHCFDYSLRCCRRQCRQPYTVSLCCQHKRMNVYTCISSLLSFRLCNAQQMILVVVCGLAKVAAVLFYDKTNERHRKNTKLFLFFFSFVTFQMCHEARRLSTNEFAQNIVKRLLFSCCLFCCFFPSICRRVENDDVNKFSSRTFSIVDFYRFWIQWRLTQF